MDIELWLIFTNRRGRGETKRGIVRLLKIHYMRRERKAQMERRREGDKGRKERRDTKRRISRRKTSFTPISIFYFLFSANFVAVSR